MAAAPAPIQVALVSAKNSPGVTTLASALGLLWPNPVVVGELDPMGGDLAARLPVSMEPGLLTLAAAARHGASGELLAEHTQRLTPICAVLVGRAGRVLSAGAVRLLAPDLPAAATAGGLSGIWDLGRLEPDSPAWPAAASCHLVVLVARPTAAELAHVVPLAEDLAAAGSRTGLVVVSPRRGRRGYRDEDVGVALAERSGITLPILGRVPFDPLGVSMAERVLPRWAGRSALGTAVRGVVDAISRSGSERQEALR